MNQGSRRFLGEWIVVDVRSNHSRVSKLGITVTRRYGESHERNRFKRIVREAFRLSYPQLPNGLDILIKPRSKAAHASMGDIRRELLEAVVQMDKGT